MEQYSVLVSVYDKENPEYLELSILSILKQEIPTDDFVIVEDGPLTDGLYDVLDRYEKQHPCIHRVRLPENVGLGCALNEGIKQCRHSLVARIDSDDIAMASRCGRQLAEFHENPALSIVGSLMYEFVDDPDNITAIKKIPLAHEEIFKFAKRRNAFNHSTVMYKKEDVIKFGLYSTKRRGQDFELFSRMLYYGCRAKNIDIPLVLFRTNKDMYRRRKSWVTTKNYISSVYHLWRIGYSGFTDLCYVLATQGILFILPVGIGSWIIQKVYRKTVA